MARTLHRLTDQQVKSLTLPPGKRSVRLADGGCLWLQGTLAKDGQRINKSWVFRYLNRSTAHEKHVGLGSYPTVSLAKARDFAASKRLQLVEGKDPLEEKTNQRRILEARTAKPVTFKEAALTYLKAHRAEWKSKVHVDQWEASLANHVFPLIGSVPVDAVTTAHVLQVLEQPHPRSSSTLWIGARETASRTRGRIEAILDAAKVQHRFQWPAGEVGNPARWRGHLKLVLPKKNKARGGHYEALPYEQLPELMAELRERTDVAARTLEFCVLTATRTGEVHGAVWSEIDMTKRLWTIPAPRMKRDRQHEIPLSDRAVAILEEMAAAHQVDRVFDTAYHQMWNLLQQLRPGMTVHGLRSSFRDWAGGCTHHPRDVIEEALAHAVGDATEAAYRRRAMLAKRATLMRDWANYCASPAAEVVQLSTDETRVST
jgi:integrase